MEHPSQTMRVLYDITEGRKLIIPLGAVNTVIDRYEMNIVLREHDFRIHTYLQIVTAETGHILDDDPLNKPCLYIGDHCLESWAVK